MTEENIERFCNEDENKVLIMAVVFGLLGFFIFLAIVFWPLAGYNVWKYIQIKEAKRIVESRKTESKPIINEN